MIKGEWYIIHLFGSVCIDLQENEKKLYRLFSPRVVNSSTKALFEMMTNSHRANSHSQTTNFSANKSSHPTELEHGLLSPPGFAHRGPAQLSSERGSSHPLSPHCAWWWLLLPHHAIPVRSVGGSAVHNAPGGHAQQHTPNGRRGGGPSQWPEHRGQGWLSQ